VQEWRTGRRVHCWQHPLALLTRRVSRDSSISFSLSRSPDLRLVMDTLYEALCWDILYSVLIAYVLGPKTLLGTLFSNILSLCSL